MVKILELMIVLVLFFVAIAVVRLFVTWEREGKAHLAPLVLLAMLVIEGTLYADPITIPRGIFHPGSGSLQLRLPEIYITLALIARLIARGRPTRIGLPAGLWLAFGAWMAVGIVEGELYHNGLSQNLYESKDLFYIVGAYALAAGVPVRRYFESGDLFKLGYLAVACISLVDLMSIGGIDVNTNLPLLPLVNFGQVGTETAALCLGIVVMCFLCKMASGPIRVRHALTLLPVIVGVFLADQRAVLVNLAAVGLVLLVVLVVGNRPGIARRFSVRFGQVVLTFLAIAGVALVVVVVPAAVDNQPVKLPFASTFQKLFHSEGKAESAQDRLNLAAEAEKLIPHHLLIGYGMGMSFQYYEAGFHRVQETNYAHDIVLDLWLRLGLIGLVLFVAALAASVVGGLRAWRRHLDPVTAALALACVAVVAGLIATAFLEPFLDEYRLATLFGVTIGMLRGTVTSLSQQGRSSISRPKALGLMTATEAAS
jgi:O-antigen ligase